MLNDLRYGIRTLLKNLGFTVIAVVTLALGIGANTAIFSVLDAVLFKPLPYKDPDRLVMVWEKLQGGHNSVSAANFMDWNSQNHVFENMAAGVMGAENFLLSSLDPPEQVFTARFSANYLDLLGVKVALGRNFLVEEERSGNDRVVILSNRFWKNRFDRDPNIVGKSLILNDRKYTVVGILAPHITFDKKPSWLATPLALDTSGLNRDYRFLLVFARLKRGITLQQAQSEMDGIAQNLSRQYPDTNRGWGVIINPLPNEVVDRHLRQTLLVLFGTVGFILLIACTNLVNLMLTRFTARQKEIAVRVALGAGRRRVFGQFLAEGLLLSVLGGGAGIFLAFWLLRLSLLAMPPWTLPPESQVTIDIRVLLFTFGISIFTAILFGSMPAWRATKVNLIESLKQGRRSAISSDRRLRNFLVASEVVIAVVLLVGAGLMIRSLYRLQQVQLGFRAANVLTMFVSLPQAKYPTGQKVESFYRNTLHSIESLHGVEDAAIVTGLPVQGDGFGMFFSIRGRTAESGSERPLAHFQMISPSYFSAMRIPLLRGRSFSEQDSDESIPVAVVNQAMVSQFFPNEDPIGKEVITDSLLSGRQEVGPPVHWQIVGVVGNVKINGLIEEASPEIYVPHRQSPWPNVHLVVRTTIDPMTANHSVRRAIRELDQDLPITESETMEQVASSPMYVPRFRTILLGLFAALALTLAAIGLYGVISYSVAERTHEMGLRMALGAERKDVLKLVMRQGMMLVLAAVVIGLLGALALTRVLSGLLNGISPTDPLTLVSVSTVLIATALFACYIPAHRATRVDPIIALRCE
jgi:putative ABC transport system permease protein